MKDIVVNAENVSKKYIISHENSRGYNTFRDNLANRAKSLFSKNKNESFEEFLALNEVNFQIRKGDKVAFLGNNGAGKSTLLKILSRITEPTSGKITLTGKVTSLLEVGTGFHPELTGRENIFLNGAILGMNKKQITERFDEIVEFSEVSKFIDTPVKKYSSGMYVRLAFSVAAHLNSDILILDEILAVGDADFQKKCTNRMKEMAEHDGRTILFVSHNIDQIKNLCDKGILLDKGKVLLEGEINEVIKTYKGH